LSTIQERAEYLVGLMPSLGKGIAERIPALKHNVQHHLTVGQLHILGFLHHRGPETMGVMAKCSHVALSTMTESINRLVKLGVVARIPDEQDRRVVRIQLTPKGHKTFKQQVCHNQEIFVKLLESLSETDQRRLVDAFRTIETILLK